MPGKCEGPRWFGKNSDQNLEVSNRRHQFRQAEEIEKGPEQHREIIDKFSEEFSESRTAPTAEVARRGLLEERPQPADE